MFGTSNSVAMRLMVLMLRIGRLVLLSCGIPVKRVIGRWRSGLVRVGMGGPVVCYFGIGGVGFILLLISKFWVIDSGIHVVVSI